MATIIIPGFRWETEGRDVEGLAWGFTAGWWQRHDLNPGRLAPGYVNIIILTTTLMLPSPHHLILSNHRDSTHLPLFTPRSHVDDVLISLQFPVVEILTVWPILLKFVLCRPSDPAIPCWVTVLEKYCTWGSQHRKCMASISIPNKEKAKQRKCPPTEEWKRNFAYSYHKILCSRLKKEIDKCQC